jgi:hypothetical protein
MKKLLVMVFLMACVAGANAQIKGGHGYYGGTRVYVVPPRVSYGFGYGPMYYSPFGYYPYGFGYGGGYYPQPYRPSKLEMQISDIKKDYADKISSAKHDDTLSKQERKAEVKRLKAERDNAIDDLKRNYHKM